MAIHASSEAASGHVHLQDADESVIAIRKDDRMQECISV